MIEELEKGHIDQRLNLTRQDEIGQMAQTMDRFADSLQNEVVDSLQKLAAGDLTFQVAPRDGQDMIRGSLKKLGDDLNNLIAQIYTSGEQIASGSTQIADGSQSLSQGATESAASVEEITASMTELASQTKQNAENATQANQLVNQAKDAAEKATTRCSRWSAPCLLEINEASQNISKIIKVIDEIAFQTNLLALNAAVGEAARASQHGEGLRAVVAEEVRNLAARGAGRQGNRRTHRGLSTKTHQWHPGRQGRQRAPSKEIVNAVIKATDLVSEIAAASNEQSQGIGQINQGLNQIDQVTQQNTANAEESAAAAETVRTGRTTAADAGALQTHHPGQRETGNPRPTFLLRGASLYSRRYLLAASVHRPRRQRVRQVLNRRATFNKTKGMKRLPFVVNRSELG
ncbi:MAG: methyl-accepting chemotaxis protein [Syntrophotaleaceae bacterium]